MKVQFHPELIEHQSYTCQRCGRGCRSFLIPLRHGERESIQALADWTGKHGIDAPFMRHRAAASGWALTKRNDGACVFLDSENLCLIHRLHGLAAKPIACQLFPFVFTPFDNELRVGLRFDCPGVCQSNGEVLTSFRKELNALAGKLLPKDYRTPDVPPLLPKMKVTAEQLDTINEALIDMAGSNALSFWHRLHWIRMFLDHLEKANWNKTPDEDFSGLVNLLKGGLLAEVHQLQPNPQPPKGKARSLLGQIMFLLCLPPNYDLQGGSLWQRTKRRVDSLQQMRRIGKGTGRLPQVQPHWPTCTLEELEEDFEEWPEDVELFLNRYLFCRLAGMNYFGPNFYDFSLVEGARSLLLALVTIGWVMRIDAIAHNRRHFELNDAHQAVMTVDGNLGYGEALAFGPARWRIDYLNDELATLIDWYCM